MYALVEIAGKQYKAVVGEKVLVDHLNLESGTTEERAIDAHRVIENSIPNLHSSQSKAEEEERWHIRKVVDPRETEETPMHSASASSASAASS